MQSMRESFGFAAVDKKDKDAAAAAWIATGIMGVARGNGVVEFRFQQEDKQVNVTPENVASVGSSKLQAIGEEFGGRIKPPITQDMLEERIKANNPLA